MANFILNTVWFLLIGWALSVLMIIGGAVLFCTVVGIPLAVICFKQSMVLAFPFGRNAPSAAPTVHITNVQNRKD